MSEPFVHCPTCGMHGYCRRERRCIRPHSLEKARREYVEAERVFEAAKQRLDDAAIELATAELKEA